MNIINKIRRILGAIKIEEKDNIIVVSGIPANVINNDISKVWKTSRINKHLFIKISKDSFSFHSFFAPDVVYMLNQLIDHKSSSTNVRVLEQVIKELYVETWLANINKEHTPKINYKKITNLIYKPLDYQEEFILNYDKLTQRYRLNGYMLAAAAGSGKTYITLALAETLSSKCIIVVCPKAALHRVWEAEIIKLFKKKQTFWLSDSGKPYRNERILVVHYEALTKKHLWLSKVRKKDPFIILDESHNFNTADSQRTELFLDVVKETNSKNVVWASGTPIKALGSEAIPFLTTIDPFFTKDVEARFKKIYGSNGLRALDILQERIGQVSFKVEKHQLGLDKPIIKRLSVKVKNGKRFTLVEIRKDMVRFINERKVYYEKRRKVDEEFYKDALNAFSETIVGDEALAEFERYRSQVVNIQLMNGDASQVGEIIRMTNRYEKDVIMPNLPKEMRKKFKDVKSVIKYTRLKIIGEALGRVLGRKRIEAHVAMVTEIPFVEICNNTTKKTVVFTSFVEVLEETFTHLKSLKMNPIKVYGKTNNELANTVEQFEKEIDVNPLIATFQSLSTAVPLVMADTMIMLNSPFRAYIHEQAISRIHRLGADTQTTVYEAYMDTGNESNISTRSGDILAWSQQQVELIMGIESPFTVEEDGTSLTVATESYDIALDYSINKCYEEVFKDVVPYLDW